MAGPTREEYLARTVTAQDKIVEANQDQYRNVQAERDAQLASVASLGLINESYIDYEDAMENYQARSDVEPLASRRARDVGADFDAAAVFRKTDKGTANGDEAVPGA